MRALNILQTAAGVAALGNCEFLMKGQRVLIKAADSVATATLTVQFGGGDAFSGPIAIEPSTDSCRWPDQLITSFIAGGNGQMQITSGGTVAGLRIDILVLAPGESVPF